MTDRTYRHDSESADTGFSVDRFRELTLQEFAFLPDLGFRRIRALEKTSSLLGTVVFLGRNVGFKLSVDLRDQCVDTQVVKVVAGKPMDNIHGGYSSDLFMHLVNHCGYRGSPTGTDKSGAEVAESALSRMVGDSARLLQDAGESLLQDVPESLPMTRNPDAPA